MRAMLVLAILICVPGASATVEGCHADFVCASEYYYAEGSCHEGYQSGGTFVTIGSEAGLAGSSDCYGYSGYGSGSSSIFVWTSAGTVYWGEFHYNDPESGEFQGCFIFVGEQYSALPCEAGAPPNPGWGDLLP